MLKHLPCQSQVHLLLHPGLGLGLANLLSCCSPYGMQRSIRPPACNSVSWCFWKVAPPLTCTKRWTSCSS